MHSTPPGPATVGVGVHIDPPQKLEGGDASKPAETDDAGALVDDLDPAEWQVISRARPARSDSASVSVHSNRKFSPAGAAALHPHPRQRHHLRLGPPGRGLSV